MGSLFIVRHAQASFLTENYDRLSATGETQSRVLGQYWAAQNLRFDRVCAGPRIRHQHTAALVGAAYRDAGLSFPEVQILPEFDEYPAELVMELGLPILLETDQRVRSLNDLFLRAVEATERRIAFQRLFESVIAKWVSGELLLEGIPTWCEFCSLVNSGLDLVLASQSRAERIAIFTSAGPTAVALQRALEISAERTLQMSWMPRNSSWSEFLYSSAKFTLSSFNSHNHLVDPCHLTYR